jgi:aspartyl-tRNA(Asn)/glutamyl-tRNA(Gln) amidotransferase subunit C
VAISREQVRAVASLARLRLTAAEEARLATDLGNILDAFARLQALDTAGVDVGSAADTAVTPLRDDCATSPPAPEELLSQAPAREGRYFRVPKILE